MEINIDNVVKIPVVVELYKEYKDIIGGELEFFKILKECVEEIRAELGPDLKKLDVKLLESRLTIKLDECVDKRVVEDQVLIDDIEFNEAFADELIRDEKNNDLVWVEDNFCDLDIVKQYFKEMIGRSLLSDEEFKVLIIKAKQGDKDAKDKIVESNLRLVISIAKRYRECGLEYLDLIQFGNLGLLKAIEKFDLNKGCKFSTYATWWIKQSITRGLADDSKTIRISVHTHDKVIKYNRVYRELSNKLGYRPTQEEVAKEMNLSVEKIEELIRIKECFYNMKSLNKKINIDNDSELDELGDYLVDEKVDVEEEVVYGALKEDIDYVLGSLTDRERTVIELRTGIVGDRVRTLEEIGKEFGVTRERIRQIEAKALRKLRSNNNKSRLRGYL